MENVYLKVDRAKIRLSELSAKLDNFFKSEPYKIDVKLGQDKKPVYLISEISDIPLEISVIFGEVIQSLRSSLDHLAYGFFKANNPDQEGKHIYFPICDDLAKYNQEKVRQTDGISSEIKNLIDSVKPYKEGNKILWQLHRLNNIDKHRLLLTVGSSYGSVDIGPAMGQFMKEKFPDQAGKFPDINSIFIQPKDNLFPLKPGDVLFVDAPGATIVPNMKFRIDVVVNETDIVTGQFVVGILEQMIKEVEGVIKKFESFFK